MGSLAKLPVELLEPVLWNLDATDIATLSCTCRSIHRVVLPYLYTYITISHNLSPSLEPSVSVSSLDLLHRALSSRTELGALIRSLRIHVPNLSEWTPNYTDTGSQFGQSRWSSMLAAALLIYLWDKQDIPGGGMKEKWGNHDITLSSDGRVVQILDDCDVLEKFEIGNASVWGGYLYSFAYHSGEYPASASASASTSSSASQPELTKRAQKARSLTGVAINSSRRTWTSPSLAENAFDFDTFLAFLYLPRLQSVSVDRLSKNTGAYPICHLRLPNHVQIDLENADGSGGLVLEPVRPWLGLTHQPMPVPMTLIRRLELNATLVRPPVLGAIVERTPLLTHLTYDCWIDCFDFGREGFSVKPFSVSSMVRALQSVKETLRYLNVSATPFHHEKAKDLHMLRWADGRLGSLKEFKYLTELVVKPWEMLYLGVAADLPVTEFLPPRLQTLEAKSGTGRVLRTLSMPLPDLAPQRTDDFLSFLRELAGAWKHNNPALKEVKIDVRDTENIWFSYHTNAVKTLNNETGLNCVIVDDC